MPLTDAQQTLCDAMTEDDMERIQNQVTAQEHARTAGGGSYIDYQDVQDLLDYITAQQRRIQRLEVSIGWQVQQWRSQIMDERDLAADEHAKAERT